MRSFGELRFLVRGFLAAFYRCLGFVCSSLDKMRECLRSEYVELCECVIEQGCFLVSCVEKLEGVEGFD